MDINLFLEKSEPVIRVFSSVTGFTTDRISDTITKMREAPEPSHGIIYYNTYNFSQRKLTKFRFPNTMMIGELNEKKKERVIEIFGRDEEIVPIDELTLVTYPIKEVESWDHVRDDYAKRLNTALTQLDPDTFKLVLTEELNLPAGSVVRKLHLDQLDSQEALYTVEFVTRTFQQDSEDVMNFLNDVEEIVFNLVPEGSFTPEEKETLKNFFNENVTASWEDERIFASVPESLEDKAEVKFNQILSVLTLKVPIKL